MTRAAFVRSALLLVLAWVMLSVAAMTWGDTLMVWLSPWLAVVAEQALPGFDAYLSPVTVDHARQLEIAARATSPFVVSDGLVLPPGATVRAGSNISHAMIPLVILVSLLVAWPAARMATRARRLLYAGLAGPVLVSVTTPLLLAGKIEMFLVDLAAREGLSREPGLLVDWTVFTEMGGRWLLPLLAAALVILLTREAPAAQAAHQADTAAG